jgi:hypothetical protein
MVQLGTIELLERLMAVEYRNGERWFQFRIGCAFDPEYEGPEFACACMGHCMQWFKADDVISGKTPVRNGFGLLHLPYDDNVVDERHPLHGKPKGKLP